MKCPECGAEIGKKAGIDIYKHAVACLHLPDKGVKELLEEYEQGRHPTGAEDQDAPRRRGEGGVSDASPCSVLRID
jgi:ssDNA-binding Zn-finger/Zn-ribbon topoisomerase 1